MVDRRYYRSWMLFKVNGIIGLVGLVGLVRVNGIDPELSE